MHSGEGYVLEALNAGAAAYLLKRSAVEELPLAIRAVVGGENFLSPAISGKVIEAYVQSAAGARQPSRITPRQRQVLRLVVEGKTSREIADRLGLSVRTVEAHRGELMARLGVSDAMGLMEAAQRLGLTREAPPE
jgi:DNA-binding NarL/FixJ family response regulator